jgi:hypothetical protein
MSTVAGAALQGLLPGFVAGLLLGWSRRASRWRPAALAVGLFAAYGLLKHWPPWPWVLTAETNDGTQWLVWSVVAAAAVAIASEEAARPRAAFLWGSAILVAQTWLMLTNLRARWCVAETAMHVTGSAAVLIASFAVLSRSLAPPSSNVTVVRLLLAALLLDSLVLAFGGSLLLAQLASAIAAALAGVLAVARRHRSTLLHAAAALPLASAHGGLLLAGHYFAEPELWTLVAAAAAPAIALAVAR